MSTSKFDGSDPFQSVVVLGNRTNLTLPTESIRIHKNGIEFRSPHSIPMWTEMTVDLQSPQTNRKIKCTGVVVACHGNRHSGYLVSMVFMNLNRQSQAVLNSLAAPRY